MRLVPTTSASKPNIAINASPRAIRARITPYIARPAKPLAAPGGLFNSVHRWRRNSDGNEEMHRQINREARRIAASGSIDAGGSGTLIVQPSGTNTIVTLKGSGTIDIGDHAAQITGGGSAVTFDSVNNKINGGGKIGGAGLTLKPTSCTRMGDWSAVRSIFRR
jgi:hypothetical protein